MAKDGLLRQVKLFGERFPDSIVVIILKVADVLAVPGTIRFDQGLDTFEFEHSERTFFFLICRFMELFIIHGPKGQFDFKVEVT